MDSGVLDAIFDALFGDLLKQLRSALHIMTLFVSYRSGGIIYTRIHCKWL